MLNDARLSSVKESPLRNMAFDESKFYNEAVITIKVNDDGDEVEEKKEAE
jgi:hypothetical protein